MRGGNRARTQVCLTLNPVFFHYPVPPFLAVRWHGQSLGRKGGRKEACAGGRSQEQLENSWLFWRWNKHKTSPRNRYRQAWNKARMGQACPKSRQNRWEPKPSWQGHLAKLLRGNYLGSRFMGLTVILIPKYSWKSSSDLEWPRLRAGLSFWHIKDWLWHLMLFWLCLFQPYHPKRSQVIKAQVKGGNHRLRVRVPQILSIKARKNEAGISFQPLILSACTGLRFWDSRWLEESEETGP